MHNGHRGINHPVLNLKLKKRRLHLKIMDLVFLLMMLRTIKK